MRFSVMEKPDTSSEQRKKQYTNHILLEVKNDVGKAWRCIRASSAARPRNIPKPFPTSFLTDKIMWLVLLSIAIVSPNYVFNLLRSKWLFSGFLGLDREAKNRVLWNYSWKLEPICLFFFWWQLIPIHTTCRVRFLFLRIFKFWFLYESCSLRGPLRYACGQTIYPTAMICTFLERLTNLDMHPGEVCCSFWPKSSKLTPAE